MSKVFDSVLVSNDLSLDRVFNTGLPVALVFYEHELSANMRQAMGDLARLNAGKALIVMLARSDALQAASRFNVTQFPTLVTIRDGKRVTTQAGVQASDLNPHIAHLLGAGPVPTPRPAATASSSVKRESTQGPLSVNEASFDREVLQSNRPVLVDFWAPWCGPCHMVAPTVEALARERAQALKVVKVNVDENPGLAGRFRTMSIPTMIIFKSGREVDRWVGALPESAIRNRVARWIQKQPQTA